jgi:predicted amidohydrolase
MTMTAAVCAIAALAVVATCHAYTAAVVQHQVRTASTAADTIAANIAQFQAHAVSASQRGANIVVFPEFALGMPTDACTTPQETAATPFCEPVSYAAGAVLCDDAAAPAMARNFSCIARATKTWVTVNSCEETAGGAYNVRGVCARVCGVCMCVCVV